MNLMKRWTISLILLCTLCMIGSAAGVEMDSGTDEPVVIDDIPPYEGPIGPDNPLYGLKLAWEDIDESFTQDPAQLMEKQMNHARLRLSEARRELAENRTDSANEALNLYWQKTNMTQARIHLFLGNGTGLQHAQEMHVQHRMVLENLISEHPDNPGLARAYNNSLRLDAQFEEKTRIRFEKIVGKDNRTIMKAYRLESRENERAGQVDETMNGQWVQPQGDDPGKGRPEDALHNISQDKAGDQQAPGGQGKGKENAWTSVAGDEQGDNTGNGKNANGSDNGKSRGNTRSGT
jgi:hypothetical protein